MVRGHLDGLIALVAAEGWTEYTQDTERSYRALSARDVTTPVALADERVVGALQVQIRRRHPGPLSMLLIDWAWRGRRLGSRLLREGLERAGGLWLDIRNRTEGYDERLGASRSLGFRLTREALGLGATATGEIGPTCRNRGRERAGVSSGTAQRGTGSGSTARSSRSRAAASVT